MPPEQAPDQAQPPPPSLHHITKKTTRRHTLHFPAGLMLTSWVGFQHTGGSRHVSGGHTNGLINANPCIKANTHHAGHATRTACPRRHSLNTTSQGDRRHRRAPSCVLRFSPACSYAKCSSSCNRGRTHQKSAGMVCSMQRQQLPIALQGPISAETTQQKRALSNGHSRRCQCPETYTGMTVVGCASFGDQQCMAWQSRCLTSLKVPPFV